MQPGLDRVLDPLRRFLRWWLGELRALVPERARAALTPKGGATVVDVLGPEITVSRASGSRRRELARLPHPGEAPPPRSGRVRGLGGGEVVLRVPAARALQKALSLPPAAEASLREILQFELDRQTPFRPDEVYFDHRVRPRPPGGPPRLPVDLTVLPRSAVDPTLAWLAHWGVEPTRVEGVPADGEDGAGWTCRLPTRGGEADEAGRGALARFLNPALAVLAVVLAATAAYVPLARQRGLLAELTAQVEAEKGRADDTLRLKEQAAALGDELGYVAAKKRSNPSVLEIWNEVTRIMPDHSFALELRLREGEVELVGQSEAATALLDVVEDSPLFQRASFRSPITRGRGGEAERFHLAFEVAERAPEGGQPPEERRASR